MKRKYYSVLVEVLDETHPIQTERNMTHQPHRHQLGRVIRVSLALFIAVLVRYTFFLQTSKEEEPLSATLSLRAELSSPVTSLRTVDEGYYVWNLNGSPYLGSAFHQQPLVLLLALLPRSPTNLTRGLAFIATDVFIGLLLYSIATIHSKENPTFQRSDGSRVDPFWVLLLYLFNPLAVINCGAVSTGLFTNLFATLALYLAYRASSNFVWGLLSMIVGALTVHLEFSLAILVIPLIYVATRRVQQQQTTTVSTTPVLVVVFLLSLCTLWGFSFMAMGGSWEFIDATYGFVFELRDLRPNIGLFWYFFAEVFMRYRSFFLFVFHLHPFAYVVPFATHFGDQYPLLYFWSLLTIVSIFKAYPTVSDVVLYLSFIPILTPFFESKLITNRNNSSFILPPYSISPHSHKHKTDIPFLSTVVTVYLFCIAIAPVMWQAWLVKGSGNANFYYAGTLVFKLVEQYVIVGAVSEALRKQRRSTTLPPELLRDKQEQQPTSINPTTQLDLVETKKER